MNINDVEPILLEAGFTRTGTSGLGNEYSRPLKGNRTATAYASFNSSFMDPKPTEEVKRIDLTIESRGTRHRCLSVKGLRDNISKIIAELDRVAQNPDLLKCPECGTREVHAKEPYGSGKQFKPFLSCDGMMVVGKGKTKDIACNGISKKLPALVQYK